MNYIEINITTEKQDVIELLMAEMLELNFESFEETETGLKAFMPEKGYRVEETDRLCDKYCVPYSITIIPPQNWNELWESNFEPISVDDFVGVRAHFHEPIKNVAHEIVITPKMSFGTGHHATTYMVMQLMRDIDCNNKTVFDFGTGTGILAILAEKLGAKEVLAIDYDDWCIENATENIERNNCSSITIQKGDTAKLSKKYDVVIANINKNIILDNLSFLAEDVVPNGQILLSGLLQEDETDILNAVKTLGWQHKTTVSRGIWIAMHFIP